MTPGAAGAAGLPREAAALDGETVQGWKPEGCGRIQQAPPRWPQGALNPLNEQRKLERIGSLSRTRTCDRSINSRLLYQLSYQGSGAAQRPCGSAHIASLPALCKVGIGKTEFSGAEIGEAAIRPQSRPARREPFLAPAPFLLL
jgi:hypothetical protein